MKEIKDCTIVQDLLPNYIDNLTNAQTNGFIKNHLKECDNCQKILENMKKEINLNTQKNDKQEVNYIKKFKNHLRTLQAILLVILLTFIITTGRKTAILMDLKNKANQSVNSTNYYMKITDYGSNWINEVYRKNEQYKTIWSSHSNQLQVGYYKNGNYNIYYDSSQPPTAKLNSSQEFYMPKPVNYFSETNFLNLLHGAVFSSITPELCNGKECYRIAFSKFCHTIEATENSPSHKDSLDGYIIYFNKKTGLPIRVIYSVGSFRRI